MSRKTEDRHGAGGSRPAEGAGPDSQDASRQAAGTTPRESEAQLRTFFEDLQDCYLRVDLDGRLVFANRAAARMLGYASPEDMLGLDVSGLYAEPQARLGLFDVLRRDGMADQFRALGRRRDGSTFWASMNARLVREDDGRVAGTEGLIRDVTEGQAAEEALRDSERRLAEIAEQSRTWAWEVDADGLYTYASHVVEQVLGYSADELVGKLHFYDLHAAEDRDDFKAAAFEAFGRREPFAGLESAAVAKDGRVVWLSTNGIPVLDAGGSLLGYRGADTDVTERRRAEDELHRFRLMVDEGNFGAAFTDMEGTLLYVNETMAAMHGRAAKDLIGRHLSVCHTEEQLALVTQLIADVRLHGGFAAVEVWHARRDGSVFPTLMNVQVISDEAKRPAFMSATIIDISERREVEEEVRRLNADLERRVEERTAELRTANRELEAFSYSVSHDLREPLRAIDGFSRILWEDYWEMLDPEGREDLERVRAAAQKMAALIDDLLSLSRLSRRDIDVAEVDLSALVSEVLGRLQEGDPARRVETLVAAGCTAHTDRGLVEIVLANLLGNAWKFSARQETARIEFGEVRVDGRRAFYVRDDGVGFEPEYADSLFRPFQRLHPASEYPGSGIGLATVQRAVARLGGRCWAESTLGEGAAFYFTLGRPAD